jgi:uncharacterized protein
MTLSAVPEESSAVKEWKFWGPWPTVGLSIAIFIVYSIAQALVVLVFFGIRIVSNPGSNLKELLTGLTTNGLMISIATILGAVVGVGFIILFIRVRGAEIAEYLGLRPINWKTFFTVLGIGVGLLVLSSVIGQYFSDAENTGFTMDAYTSSVWPPLLGIAVVVFAPAFEEGLFRGFLLVGLARTRIGAVGAILITAVGWAALHIQYNVYGMLSILVLGIAFGIVRLKTGSLWSTLILHAFWNLAAIIAIAISAATGAS